MKFIIAYDGSHHAKEAIRYVLPYLANADAVVFVGFKPESKLFASQETANQMLADANTKASDLAHEGIRLIQEAGESALPAIRCVRSGWSVGEELVEFAEDEAADCIVLGTRGFGEFKSKVFGSVAQRVLFACSRVPALIVHDGAAATREEHGHALLFPIDGSSRSLQAVQAAGSFVTEGCNVFVFHASEKPQPYTMASGGMAAIAVANTAYEKECSEYDALNKSLAAAALEKLDASSSVEVPKENLHFITHDSCSPSDGIRMWQQQNERRVDMVVVGSRGQKGMSRVWNGSLAHDLLHEAQGFALLVTHERSDNQTKAESYQLSEDKACCSLCG
eukprot:TRINITY_DN9243_c0_g1_i3.p1 TRINITY_DN9243_c0_g1~~TRINITY_DN9243_c0_g1_i3.p1  ORF type:complete len:335 (-),score=76.73 TRINITY_DN9243_c0_g1_i3:362-1366(-)